MLRRPGARALAGGTDLAGQLDRRISRAELLVDLQAAGLGSIAPGDGGLAIGATVTLADLAGSPALEPYEAVGRAASQAASALLRNAGTVAATSARALAAGTTVGSRTCWLGGGAPATHRSATTESTGSSPATASPRIRPTLRRHSASGATWSPAVPASASSCCSSLLPSPRRSVLLVLEPGELVTDPAALAPERVDYLRTGERRAFCLLSLFAPHGGVRTRAWSRRAGEHPARAGSGRPPDELPGHARAPGAGCSRRARRPALLDVGSGPAAGRPVRSVRDPLPAGPVRLLVRGRRARLQDPGSPGRSSQTR